MESIVLNGRSPITLEACNPKDRRHFGAPLAQEEIFVFYFQVKVLVLISLLESLASQFFCSKILV